ncbi:hypothetical protein [Deinococcus aerophilus]|uniref:Uncharacterized protein n=1 Tax=Deinococcus aerophilus TaxID=522488 RepID=A0ABQ2GMP7_9DEIO|nr:hypothetical protein [Deinococcus aerophilus]GGM03872.1 hypothetical protein GCM10010841_10280 [Deinococcus aerophilus]
MNVLNIPVSSRLQALWRSWLAPSRQPFFLTPEEACRLALPTVARSEVPLTPEERDTNALWNISAQASRVAWLGPDDWAALDPGVRREVLRLQVQHGRGNIPRRRDYADLLPGLPEVRFLWTPDLLTDAGLGRVISRGGPGCHKPQVPQGVWKAASASLPRVQELAGSFAGHSGANCFGAVMGAAGIAGAESEWMQRGPFEAFVRARTRPGGADDRPGTVLIWRSADGLLQHAALTLGGGWAFHKASQVWTSPRLILPVADLKRVARERGRRLTRRTLIPAR